MPEGTVGRWHAVEALGKEHGTSERQVLWYRYFGGKCRSF